MKKLGATKAAKDPVKKQQPKLGATKVTEKRTVAPKEAVIEVEKPKEELSLLERVQKAMNSQGKQPMTTLLDVPQRQLNQGISDKDLNWFQEHVGRRQQKPDHLEGGSDDEDEPVRRAPHRSQIAQPVSEESKIDSDDEEEVYKKSTRKRRNFEESDDEEFDVDIDMDDDSI